MKVILPMVLFMEREKYVEGWAVYDLDNKSGRTSQHHKEAREDPKKVDNLHIAFSSYSIEEWFLLHFERNPKAFENSECKDKNKQNNSLENLELFSKEEHDILHQIEKTKYHVRQFDLETKKTIKIWLNAREIERELVDHRSTTHTMCFTSS